MSIPSSAVTQFRGLWADRFVDTVTVTRVASRGTFNTSTLAYTTPSDSTPYTGEALIRPGDSDEQDLYGGEEVTGEKFDVYLPHDAGQFDLEDTVTVGSSVYDTRLAGQVLRVVAYSYDSYLTRIRLRCRMDLGSGYGG